MTKNFKPGELPNDADVNDLDPTVAPLIIAKRLTREHILARIADALNTDLPTRSDDEVALTKEALAIIYAETVDDPADVDELKNEHTKAELRLELWDTFDISGDGKAGITKSDLIRILMFVATDDPNAHTYDFELPSEGQGYNPLTADGGSSA